MTIDTLINLIGYLNYCGNSTVRVNTARVNYIFQDQVRAIHFYGFIDDLIDQLELCDVEASLSADFDVSSKTFSYTVKIVSE